MIYISYIGEAGILESPNQCGNPANSTNHPGTAGTNLQVYRCRLYDGRYSSPGWAYNTSHARKGLASNEPRPLMKTFRDTGSGRKVD